ncbi:MAG: glycosyltransferase [Chthoniobacteraceae bacterium]
MKPLVTIGIPCFNAEPWLAAAIESALAQTWPAIEVIVVDDGSSDRSREIARGFAGKIRLIETDHLGGNHARNTALREARGEWAQFLDADDTLEPEKIARQFAETRDGAEADAIYSPHWFERGGGRWVAEIDPSLDLFAQWLAWQLPQTGAVLWRKSALDALGGWKEDQPCCQEHELYLRALKAGLRFVFAPTPHAVYRLWSEDTVCRKDPHRTIRVKTALLDDARTWLTERDRWTAQHQRITARACFEMARTLARSDLAEAAAYHAERHARGLIAVEGPAAPLPYRIAHTLLGFEAAERIAASMRRS